MEPRASSMLDKNFTTELQCPVLRDLCLDFKKCLLFIRVIAYFNIH